MNVHFLHTPTFEANLDEALEGYLKGTTSANTYSLSAKGRNGKPSIRSGGTGSNGLVVDVQTKGLGLAGKNFRCSFDLQLDNLSPSTSTAYSIFELFNGAAAGGSINTTTSTSRVPFMIDSAGALSLGSGGLGTGAVSGPGKTLAKNTVYTVEIEALLTTSANSFIRVWVDGELVLTKAAPAARSASAEGIVGMRFENPGTNNTTTGTHVSNLMIYDDDATTGVPLGPLDFAYVPVTDADLSETTTNDSSSFETFTTSEFVDFALAADSRTGAAVAYAASARARTNAADPGLIDVKAGSTTLATKAAVATAAWTNMRLPPQPGAPPATISVRNSPS